MCHLCTISFTFHYIQNFSNDPVTRCLWFSLFSTFSVSNFTEKVLTLRNLHSGPLPIGSMSVRYRVSIRLRQTILYPVVPYKHSSLYYTSPKTHSFSLTVFHKFDTPSHLSYPPSLTWRTSRDLYVSTSNPGPVSTPILKPLDPQEKDHKY